jgi:hypothetical protein
MKFYCVYVKDKLTQSFKTVHVVCSATCGLRQILEYASTLTNGGDAFGLKEFGNKEPVGFIPDKIVDGIADLERG